MTVLKLREVPKEKSNREIAMERFEEMVEKTREWMKAAPNDQIGCVIAAYSKEGVKAVNSCADYHLADAMDSFAIPEFIRTVIINIRDA